MIIDSACTLSYGDNSIIVGKDTEYSIPIAQVRSILINARGVTVSAALISELAKNNIHSVFCDERHNPSCEISAFSSNTGAAGKIMDQCLWCEDRKLEAWRNIVTAKIKNQRVLLEKLKLTPHIDLRKYESAVLPGDTNNCEAAAAHVYFKTLFGNKFVRHSDDDINSALNYGYILVLNMFNRILSVHGYHTALGIKHCSRQNRFNLSCDLMEPFRPFVDRIVFENIGRRLDWEYKKTLIEGLQAAVRYGKREMRLAAACESYSLDVLRNIDNEEYEIKELCFD